MISYLSQSRLSVFLEGCIPNYPFQKELWSLSRRLGTTCMSFSLRGGRSTLDTALTPLLHGRNQDVWGPDAHAFRPERWFEMKDQVESPVGVYGNLYAVMHGNLMGQSNADPSFSQFYILRRCKKLRGLAVRVG